MAHMIDMSNARANMAYVGETPWHGLGTVLKPDASIEEWLVAAGLNWSASMRPSFYPATPMNGDEPWAGEMIQSDDNFHVVRDDTHKSLGVMTGRYNPVQPKGILEFFRDFILTDDRFVLETAGSLKGGKVIWALAKFSESIQAGGDEHVPYVLLTTSYNGSLATTAQATMIRVVCNNTLTASIYSADKAMVKVPHARKWDEATMADAHARLEAVAAEFDHYKSLADAFAVQRMSRDQTKAFLEKLILPKDKKLEECSGRIKAQYDALFASYVQTAKETEAGTAWAALNAVTRFVDHDRNTRRRGEVTDPQDARMASAFYGSGAALKSQAVKLLMAA